MSPGRRFVLLVGAAVLVGCGLRGAIGLTDDAPSTDETAYLRSGASLVDGDGFVRGDRPELHFPPLVPFVLGSVGRLTDDPHRATVLMTWVCGTLLIVPLALLGRRVGGPGAGIATAWVAALAPGLATTPAARGAGSEAEYALLLVTAVWLVLVAGDHTGPRRALCASGAGLLVGLAYLTRPEGLFATLPLAATLAWTAYSGYGSPRRPTTSAASTAHAVTALVPSPTPAPKLEPALVGVPGDADHDAAGGPGSVAVHRVTALADGGAVEEGGRVRRDGVAGGRAAVGVVGAFVVPLVMCVAPYVAFLHTHTGEWELTAKTQDASIEAWHAVARNDRQARDAVLYELDATGTGFAAGSAPLAELAREDPAGYLGILGTNVVNLGRNLSGWWLLPLPVWIVAGIGAWRLRRTPAAPTVALLLAVAALPVATSLAFFVQPRYLVLTVALTTVLVGSAVASWTTRHRRTLALAGGGLLAVCSAAAFYGPGGWWHPGDLTDQRRAGEWLAAHTSDDDRIVTRSFVVDHYADRPTVAIPYADLDEIVAFGRRYGAQYLVVDQYTVETLRPQLAPLAAGADTDTESTDGLDLVHEVVAEGRTTRIFAFTPPPPTPDIPEADIPSLGFTGDAVG